MYEPKLMTWFNPDIQYLFGREIIEYDIQSAGLSISKEYRLLPEETIRQLEVMEKSQRNVRMGLLRRDDKVYSKRLSEKFTEVRKVFIMMNNLSDPDILTVKNDAIFTIGEQQALKFGSIVFRAKNRYHSYIRLLDDKIEVFFGDAIDVKGMGVNAVNSHRLYLLNFLESIVSKIELRSPSAIRKCIRFIDEFKTGDLEDQYYLEFNPRSKVQDPMQVYTKFLIPILMIALRECK